LRATPPGDNVYAISKTVAFDGRKVDFEVEAFDSKGLIGKGTHQRFVVNSARFIDKLKGKSEK
ncbi:MAG TPA: dihydrolipoamide acyltransferase, partial [Salinivirgaceae bacterium]|nr:dihydrolipoamide acyltransferase [Salinivirgaceae bacterium]